MTATDAERYLGDLREVEKLRRVERGYGDVLYFAYEYFSEDRNPGNDDNLIPAGVTIDTAPEFHRELTAMLDSVTLEKRNARIAYACPRGHGKSAYLSNVFPTHQVVYELRKYILGEALLPVIKDFCTWAADAATKIVEWFTSTEGQTVLQTLTDTIYKVIDGIKAFCSWLGDQLSPLFQSIQTDINNVIDTLKTWLTSTDASAWFDSIKTAAEGVINKITEVYNILSDNWSTVIPILAGVVATVWAFNAATAVMGVVAGIQAAGGLAGAASAAWGFAAALLANPATWIALAIGVLIAAVIYLWLNWDKVSAWLSASWDAIKAKATEIFNGIATFLTGVWDGIASGVTTAWTNVSTTITGLWQGILDFFGGINLSATATAIINTFGAGITTAWATITGGLSGLWAQVTGFFGGISLNTIGSNIISGLWEGLKSAWKNVTAWFDNMLASIPQWVRDALGIHSPSRVMMELGDYTMQGFVKGLDDKQNDVKRSAVSIADTPVRAVSATVGALENEAPAPAITATAPATARQISLTIEQIILQNVRGDLREAADELMGIIAEKLQTEGDLVAEGS